MKEEALNNFINECISFCEHQSIKIKDVRQSYFSAKPVVSFWVDSERIESVTFRQFKRGIKYSVVVKDEYTSIYTKLFGEPSAAVGNKTISQTWMTYDPVLFVHIALFNESSTSPEELYQAELESTYSTLGHTTGYWAKRFIQSVRKNGAVAHTKKALSNKKQEGFERLIEVGRVDLSLEFIALKKQYISLFTQAELNEAKRRLSTVPPYAWRKDVDAMDNFSGEFDDEEESLFSEGAKKTVVVNKYERSPQARKACLEKHGYKCKVCEFSFLEKYGEIGKGFIHVHHIKPIAAIAKDYKVNAEDDLVPVCPNCHAMLHTKTPPLSIEELRVILTEQLVSVN